MFWLPISHEYGPQTTPGEFGTPLTTMVRSALGVVLKTWLVKETELPKSHKWFVQILVGSKVPLWKVTNILASHAPGLKLVTTRPDAEALTG